MAILIQFEPQDDWQFSVDVFRVHGAGLVARLTDARTTLIEGNGQPAEKLQQMADMLEEGAKGMRETAKNIRPAKS